MEIKEPERCAGTATLGDLPGGTVVRLAPLGALYIRASGATGKLKRPETEKLLIALKDGRIYPQPSNKQVIVVKVIAEVQA